MDELTGLILFNSYINLSYGVILMILHYLQSALEPPILPNLIALFPRFFDGTCALEELKIQKKLFLPRKFT